MIYNNCIEVTLKVSVMIERVESMRLGGGLKGRYLFLQFEEVKFNVSRSKIHQTQLEDKGSHSFGEKLKKNLQTGLMGSFGGFH